MEGQGTKAASVAMKRIMKECKDMQSKKQMFLYAQPLEVRYLTDLKFRTNHSNGTSLSKGHQTPNILVEFTMGVSLCLTSIR